MHFRGFRIAVITSFTLFLFVGMMLTGIVFLFLWQQHVITFVIQESEDLLKNLAGESFVIEDYVQSQVESSQNDGYDVLKENLMIDFVYFQKDKLFGVNKSYPEEIIGLFKRSKGLDSIQKETYGSFLSLFGLQSRYVGIALPMQKNDVNITIGAILHIPDISSGIVKRLPVVAIYLVVNLIVLTALWFFRIRQLIFVPLEKLVQRAERVGGGDVDFIGLNARKNEFGKIAFALSNMIERIENDRKKLDMAVKSLEEANRQILANQQSLVDAEKFAAVGRLAAGLAHEIGNPLGIIQGYVELLDQEELTTEQRNQYSQRAGKELDRVTRLIRQLLDLASKQHSSNASSAVGPVIIELKDMLIHQKSSSGITFYVENCELDMKVSCSEADLHQILLNCILNSIDAIRENEEEKGQITIRCKSLSDEKKRSVSIEVVDNGKGIDEKDIPSIFDPFYTTKEVGKGTGLGLSVTRSIVENCGGAITINSTSGIGTTVSIQLPVKNESFTI